MKHKEKEKFLKEIRTNLSEKIDLRKSLDDEEIKDIITNLVFERSKTCYIGVSERKELIDILFNSMRRLDILQPILEDNSVTEIMINGPDNIFIERDGKVEKVNAKFENSNKLEDIIQSIVGKVNRTVNEASPIVDARLNNGSRVNVVLPPVALNGPVMTIRKFSDKPMTVDTLIRHGSVDEVVAEFLEKLVLAKYNIFICGGTGSGKTTFLNAVSNFIPKDERIITIEDSAELQITGVENLVRMETRNANTAGEGAITIRDLIKASLRMRPERIVVGEVRGSEAIDMLQAMNTGHDGSLSTGHANSTKDMLSRLETMVLMAAELPLEAIRQQIASAIEIIIYLGRLRDKTRKTLEIAEVVGYKDGEIVLNPLYVFEEEAEIEGKIKGKLIRTQNKMVHIEKFKMRGLKVEI